MQRSKLALARPPNVGERLPGQVDSFGIRPGWHGEITMTSPRPDIDFPKSVRYFLVVGH